MATPSVDSAGAGSVSVSVDAAQLLADAEEQIEAWLCELDATWIGILADARAEANGIVAAAKAHAAEIVAWAEVDANAIRAAAAVSPATETEQAESTVDMAGSVDANDLVALAAAVEQLRVELSRVVEAAFDALPAVEATAAALRTVQIEEPVVEPVPRRHRGLLRRLTRSRA